MKKRERAVPLLFYVTAEEKDMIEQKMLQLGTDNRSAYLRKMALDGYVVKLDLPELKEMISLLRHTSNNFNQLTKRVNASGRIYNEDLADIHASLDRLWGAANEILRALAKIP